MLRLMSPNPNDVQIAAMGIYIFAHEQAGTETFLGVCDCAQAQKLGIILASDRDGERCALCGQIVHLARIPPTQDLIKELQHGARSPKTTSVPQVSQLPLAADGDGGTLSLVPGSDQ